MKARYLALAAIAALAACSTSASTSDVAITHTPLHPEQCYARDVTVYFDGQSTEVSQGARTVLDATGEALRGCRINHVTVIGSTDAASAAAVSDAVARQRAIAIGDYLERHAHWPHAAFELRSTGERGATTDEGLNVPMRDRGRVIIDAAAQ